ncbi:MAG: hypothetical protein R8G66_26200 [Cytophagales bacterium]|nr:hypothetical protein [Cytophagales bacterium]
MIITSVLLLLASIMPFNSKQDIDEAKYTIYDHLDAGNIDSAHFYVDRAISFSKSIDYNFGEAKSIFIKSYLHRVNNELGESFVLNLEALRLLTESSDKRTPKTLVDIYLNTGEILIRHYQYDEAIRYFDQGLVIALEHNLKVRTHELTYSKGEAMMRKEAYPVAFDLFKQSFEMSLETKDEWTILNSLNYMGVTAIEMEDYALARYYFKQIEEFSFEVESKTKFLGFAYHNIGESYFREGDNSLAERYFKLALGENQQLSDSVRIFENQLRIAQLMFESSRLNTAKELATISLKCYNQLVLLPENYQVYDLLTQISFALNDSKQASFYHRKYVDENEAFLFAQKETLKLSQQHKMDLLTASFFKDMEKQEQMAQLNQIIYLLLGLGLLSFIFVRAKKYLLKRSLEQAFREVAQKKNLYF